MTAKNTKNSQTAKLDAELLRQAKVVCAYRGLEMYDYLNDLLRGPVAADFKKIVRAAPENEKGGKS